MNKRILSVLTLILVPFLGLWASGSKEPPKTAVDAQEEPVRVVSCGKGFSLVLDAIYLFPEALPSLVAMGKTSQAGGNFIEYLDPHFGEKALFAMDVSAEEIASHRPDWVIIKSYLTSSLGAQLTALSIPVLSVDLETPEQYTRDLTAIGEILGNPGRASDLVSYFDGKREWVSGMTRDLAPEKQPRVLFLSSTVKGGTVSFNVPPADWMQSLLFQWAGAEPVWAAQRMTGWTEVNFEQIAAWNPEYIFIVSYHTPVMEVKEALLADPRWKELSAVRAGKLLAFPGDYLSWDQPDPRWILGLFWLTNTLHPELLDDARMDAELRNFFSFAWGLTPEAVERDIVPRIVGDYR